MSERYLLIAVYLLDGRYNGVGDWPPSPFRLFQALVSAAHTGRSITAAELGALAWLEGLRPPLISAPKAQKSRSVTYYVPNNDLDTVGGDPARIAGIRTAKQVAPWLFDNHVPFLYIWNFEHGEEHSAVITMLAEGLYQLGRGVDMAFASGEVLDTQELENRLNGYSGNIYRPTPDGAGNPLRCPKRNASLTSLESRHAAQLIRLKDGALRQALPPDFSPVSYDSPPTRLLYDITRNDSHGAASAQPLEKVVVLSERIRDLAARRLKSHLGAGLVERIIIGRNAGEADKRLRVRIIPLPSIGFTHADRQVRRILVEVPPDCPIAVDDVDWAFSSLDLGIDVQTGELLDPAGPSLIKTEDLKMLPHYGVDPDEKVKARVWRTVTPAALPARRSRGRISGSKRNINEAVVGNAARQALRHAGLDSNAEVRRVQRESFEAKGIRAGTFSHGERFRAEKLRHLEIAFAEPVCGPIVIGDGRYLGLGLMYPASEEHRDVVILPVLPRSRPAAANHLAFLRAVRRSLMARAREINGAPGELFSGHEPDGTPARSGRHKHVFLAADDADDDGCIDRLLIIAPWRVDRSSQAKQGQKAVFEQVAAGLRIVRAGELGVIEFGEAVNPTSEDHLFRRSQCWRSHMPYVPTRHPRKEVDAISKLKEDIIKECVRRGLPQPDVEVADISTGPRGGIRLRASLAFSVAVFGPVVLGRDSHTGGGLFHAVDCITLGKGSISYFSG